MAVVVSSFDIASRLTGWCSGTGETVPDVGVFEFDHVGKDLGLLGETFERYLGAHFDRFQPEEVVYEAPILVTGNQFSDDPARRRADTLLPLRKIYGMGVLLETFCRRQGVRCGEVTIAAIKKEVTGNRHAEKDALVAVARKCGLVLPAGPGAKDAADAWGGWLIGVRTFNRSLTTAWDRRIFSTRGSLL